jgi:hypothetical protein
LSPAHDHSPATFLLNHQEYKTISAGKNYFKPQGKLHRSFREILVIDCIESFEKTFIIRLLFTGFECEKEIIGMVPADIGNTVPE